MRILIVGAGAVGQVYGRHLRLGGAEIGFLVRSQYAAQARGGFDLYPLNRRDPRRAPVRFEDFSVVTSPKEAAASRWDAVVLCVSSTALRAGPWLEELAPRIGDATLVALQPGLDDREFALRFVPESRVVTGLIGIVSYLAPLPGEIVPRPGVAYWLPPLSETPFSGPADRARAMAEAFRRGGLSSRIRNNVTELMAFGAAALNLHIVALECAGWSLRGLRRGGRLRLANRAVREAVAIAARRLAVPEPLWIRLLWPMHARWAMILGERVAPLDLETYLRVHFTKVGDQTRLLLRTYIELASRYGLPSAALRRLSQFLERPTEGG